MSVTAYCATKTLSFHAAAEDIVIELGNAENWEGRHNTWITAAERLCIHVLVHQEVSKQSCLKSFNLLFTTSILIV